MLPEVRDSAADFGSTQSDLFGSPIPILGVAGDQQAAALGQACIRPGMMKTTYGTGAFALLNTGDRPVSSKNRLLTTIACQLDGKATYALEGSIFIAGAVVQWLRDGLKIIRNAAESQALAESADTAQSVYLVPACPLPGLAHPGGTPNAVVRYTASRGATGPAELARAALESVGFQTRDLWEAIRGDWAIESKDAMLRVDGGMTASDWTMQFIADILDTPVDRPRMTETTALGAAWLAGHKAGVWPGAEEFANSWALGTRFTPSMERVDADRRYEGWKQAVKRTLVDLPGAP